MNESVVPRVDALPKGCVCDDNDDDDANNDGGDEGDEKKKPCGQKHQRRTDIEKAAQN